MCLSRAAFASCFVNSGSLTGRELRAKSWEEEWKKNARGLCVTNNTKRGKKPEVNDRHENIACFSVSYFQMMFEVMHSIDLNSLLTWGKHTHRGSCPLWGTSSSSTTCLLPLETGGRIATVVNHCRLRGRVKCQSAWYSYRNWHFSIIQS